MYLPMYIEINLICVAILWIILVKEKQDTDKQYEHTAFAKVIVAILILIFFDISWVVVEKTTDFASINAILSSAYMFETGVLSYYWLEFTDCKLHKNHKKRTSQKLIAGIPLAVLLVICVLTPWTGWLFYIDEMNQYHRGQLHYLQWIICYGYLIYSGANAMIYYFKEKNAEKKSEYLTVASFIVLPIIGAVIQTISYSLPLTTPTATISILMVYVNFQSKQISTDGLTGLNNRRQLDRFLNSRNPNKYDDEHLYMAILDINDFKKINDTYGHMEGDIALTIVADVLKKVCEKYNAFVARYGGDEFAVVLLSKNDNTIMDLICEISNELEITSSPLNLKYSLSLSIGKSKCNCDDDEPIKKMISDADEDMYFNKQNYKLRRNIFGNTFVRR